MKYNVISYLIGEGIRNVFKNKKSTISALTVMFLCMVIFGIFFILSENISNIMNTVEEAQGFSVFFNLGTSQERISDVGEQIKTLEGIKNIEFISGEESLNEYKEGLGERGSALNGMEENFLPDAYKVTLSDLSLNEQIQQKVTEIVGDDLEEIVSGDDEIAIIMNIGKEYLHLSF